MPRSKRIRTLYNPAVGCKYLIKNTKTGAIESASTLTVRDVDQKPWRSPKGTPVGEEFFKMKIGKKQTGFTYIKFINSALNEKCLSDDGEWEFMAETPDGKKLPKLTVGQKKSTKKKVTIKAKREKPKKEKKEEKVVEIREDIFDTEFIDQATLSEILGE